MPIMECRYTDLERTLDGLNHTNVPLISEYNGNYLPAGFTDDQGIYYFVPTIAKFFGLSIDQAINVFSSSIWIIGTIIAICSFLLIFKHWCSRLISIKGLLMLVSFAKIYCDQDVYNASFFAVTATIPLFVGFGQQYQFRFNLSLFLALIFSGIVIGCCNFIRCYSGVGALLFIVLWVFLNKKMVKKERVFCVLVLLVFTYFPYLHFRSLENKRDSFLRNIQPNYQPISVKHPIWHTVYAGLGYLKNKHGIEYSDSCSFYAAKAMNPQAAYCSEEYDQALKKQVFLIVKKDPSFVIKTVLKKISDLCLQILIFSNFGLLLYFYVKPHSTTIVPFIVAALFYSIPGVLALPQAKYVFGMISVAVIFGVYMIGLGVEKYLKTSLSEKEGVIA